VKRFEQHVRVCPKCGSREIDPRFQESYTENSFDIVITIPEHITWHCKCAYVVGETMCLDNKEETPAAP
jgi:hypothetical protein